MTQAEALTILKTGANVYLTGEPWERQKRTTINEFRRVVASIGHRAVSHRGNRNRRDARRRHDAPLLERYWHHGALSRADVDRIASKEHVARRIAKAKVLIIEEISMLSATTFEMADKVCREVRRSEKPFGGLHGGSRWRLLSNSRQFQKGREVQFAYASPTWRDLNLPTCYLTEQYRQDDTDFLERTLGDTFWGC